MKRSLYLPLVALLALAPAARAGHFLSCCNGGIHCMVPPEECPDCSEPSPSCACSECTRQLIDQLCHGECCCDRIKAAKKLGCCVRFCPACDKGCPGGQRGNFSLLGASLSVDLGWNPEVVEALVGALECDTCWEVRQTAAWSIAMQGARTQYAVLALYLASKLDHHYMVRDRAKAALEVLLLCHRECYRQLFDSVDAAAGKIKPYYNPTKEQCIHLAVDCGCITVHVCKAPPEEKQPEKEKCLIPITVVEDGTCPSHKCAACAGCQAAPAGGAIPYLPPPGTPLPQVPAGAVPGTPGAPEPLRVPPVPATPRQK